MVKSIRTDHLYPGEYLIEKLLDKRRVDNKFQYLVRWEGWSSFAQSWEDKENLPVWAVKKFDGYFHRRSKSLTLTNLKKCKNPPILHPQEEKIRKRRSYSIKTKKEKEMPILKIEILEWEKICRRKRKTGGTICSEPTTHSALDLRLRQNEKRSRRRIRADTSILYTTLEPTPKIENNPVQELQSSFLADTEGDDLDNSNSELSMECKVTEIPTSNVGVEPVSLEDMDFRGDSEQISMTSSSTIEILRVEAFEYSDIENKAIENTLTVTPKRFMAITLADDAYESWRNSKISEFEEIDIPFSISCDPSNDFENFNLEAEYDSLEQTAFVGDTENILKGPQMDGFVTQFSNLDTGCLEERNLTVLVNKDKSEIEDRQTRNITDFTTDFLCLEIEDVDNILETILINDLDLLDNSCSRSPPSYSDAEAIILEYECNLILNEDNFGDSCTLTPIHGSGFPEVLNLSAVESTIIEENNCYIGDDMDLSLPLTPAEYHPENPVELEHGNKMVPTPNILSMEPTSSTSQILNVCVCGNPVSPFPILKNGTQLTDLDSSVIGVDVPIFEDFEEKILDNIYGIMQSPSKGLLVFCVFKENNNIPQIIRFSKARLYFEQKIITYFENILIESIKNEKNKEIQSKLSPSKVKEENLIPDV